MLPLSALVAPLLAADKLYDLEAVKPLFNTYLRALTILASEPKLREWIACRVAKNTRALQSLASFRSTWMIEYRRRETGSGKGETIEGTASLPSLLTNYIVRLASAGEKRAVVEIVRPSRKNVSETLQAYSTSSPNSQKAKTILDSIMPASIAKRILGIHENVQDTPEERIIAEMLDAREPVYIADPNPNFELLVAYGYAIRIKSKLNEKTVAYIIPI
jgi:hypothetical protein